MTMSVSGPGSRSRSSVAIPDPQSTSMRTWSVSTRYPLAAWPGFGQAGLPPRTVKRSTSPGNVPGHAAPAAYDPRVERKVVTVLFTDVTGSTQLADRLDVEDLREVMSEWFAAVRAEIEAQGGTVEKYIGDAVMAVFGVPNAHEDDPVRALRAALAIRERLIEVNRSLESAYGITMQIRTGINTGEAV